MLFNKPAIFTSLHPLHFASSTSLHFTHFTSLHPLHFASPTSVHFTHFTSLHPLHFVSLTLMSCNLLRGYGRFERTWWEMEASRSSETLVAIYKTGRCQSQKYCILYLT
jgi:hypothetical protein